MCVVCVCAHVPVCGECICMDCVTACECAVSAHVHVHVCGVCSV